MRMPTRRIRKPALLIALAAAFMLLSPHATAMDGHSKDHTAVHNLVPIGSATHVAVADGDWSHAATWSGGVPGAGARVHIPTGRHVRYDLASSPTLNWVRVDGTLAWAIDRSTEMRLDTLAGMTGGRIDIGTPQDPLPAHHTARIGFVDSGNITDAARMGRGLLTMGALTVHGARRLPFTFLAQNAVAGSTTIMLRATPHGWRVGDRLVIAATHAPQRHWNGSFSEWVGTEDEVRQVAAINGQTITLNAPLQYTHDAPAADLGGAVANATRNIVFATLGDQVPTQRRAHTMIMGSETRVSWAAFEDLGRTDKSILVDDPQVNLDGSVGNATNPRGRYSMHVHKIGASTDLGYPVVIRGCAVWGSPGWGVAVHGSHAVVEDCVSYNVFGCHYVTEDGNELGAFRRNIAILSEGDRHRHVKEGTENHDLAFNGQGFWLQGRNFLCEDNVAVSCNQAGFILFHRSGVVHPRLPQETLRYRAITKNHWDEDMSVDATPVRSFVGNTAIACESGLTVIKANPNQGHDIRNMFKRFTAWNVINAWDIEYTAHYTFIDSRAIADARVISDDDFGNQWASRGLNFGNNSDDMTIVRPQVTGWRPDRRLHANANPGNTEGWFPWNRIDVIDGNLPMIDGHLWMDPVNPEHQRQHAGSSMVAGRLSFTPAPDLVFSIDHLPELAWQRENSWILRGTVVDSLGPQTRESRWSGYVIRHTFNQGTFRANGRRYIALLDLWADRVTGDIMHYPYLLDVTKFADTEPNLGAPPADVTSLFAGDSPQAQANSYSTPADRQLDVPAAQGLLINDTADDGAVLRVEVSQVSRPQHGVVSTNANGSFTYLPDIGFTGTDTFTYIANDGLRESQPATVMITVGGSSGGSDNSSGGADQNAPGDGADNQPPTAGLPENDGSDSAPAGGCGAGGGVGGFAFMLLMLTARLRPGRWV